MLRTPLYQFHAAQKATFVPYAGYEMPMFYSGVHEEHRQVRTAGGIFDVSHMGRLKIQGRHARKFLERVCTRRISDMQAGQCRYSLVCNEQGGVRDDVIVYRMDEDEFLMVVNAANREKILGHFEAVRSSGDFVLKITDLTESTAMVALQGPKVMGLIGKFSTEIPTLKRYRFAVKNLLVMKLTVSRTGYTGEDGVEIILPAGAIDMGLKFLLKDVDMASPEAIIRPAGLGCRDTLRLEAGMPLYGHELGEEINALSCGVDFAIALDKDKQDRGERFIGQDALEKTRDAGGPARKLVGIKLGSKRTARQGNAVVIDGKPAGEVTSGCLSPTLGFPIAMALVDAARTGLATSVKVQTGRDELPGEIVPLPFYKAKP